VCCSKQYSVLAIWNWNWKRGTGHVLGQKCSARRFVATRKPKFLTPAERQVHCIALHSLDKMWADRWTGTSISTVDSNDKSGGKRHSFCPLPAGKEKRRVTTYLHRVEKLQTNNKPSNHFTSTSFPYEPLLWDVTSSRCICING
jgi:hypothetical protein